MMHDLLHELAQQVARGTCLRLENIEDEHGETFLRAQHIERGSKARHFSYPRDEVVSIKKSELFQKKNIVRSFLSFSPRNIRFNFFNNKALHQLLKFKKLRVLSLYGYSIEKLPDSIGDLKHLRYLDLSETNITYLPESTCSLYNLQMLSLLGCYYLEKLPSKMENLINLWYLDITHCDRLNEMPIGLKELKSLQVLSSFSVSKGDGCGVQELLNFKDLRGTLCISNLENVVDANEAKKADLSQKKLEILALKWGVSFGDSRNADTEKRVLDMLRPHKSLKELTMRCYAGNVFSEWLGFPSFSSMTLLKLVSCKRCTCLPPLGQLPSLKVLEIKSMEAIQHVGSEFYGSTESKLFPSLETLTFEDMPNWKSWTSFEVIISDKQVEVFSCLVEFSLLRCPELSGKLPNHFASLKKIVIVRCEKLEEVPSSFLESCKPEICRGQRLACAITTALRETELIRRNLPCRVEDLELIECCMIEILPITVCNLKHLRKLFINGCSNLVSIPSALLFSSVLEAVSIIKCEKLQILANGMEEDFNYNNLSTSGVKDLSVSRCPTLEFVAKTLPASLKTLKIDNCSGLKVVAETFLEDTKTESIIVEHCPNLEALPNGMCNLTSLTNLNIFSCPRLNFAPGEGFPANLVELKLSGENILRPFMEWRFDRLTCLKSLSMVDSEMEEMIEINLPTSLTKFTIYYFPMLVSSSNCFGNLTSLEELYIFNCPNLKSLPNEGLPPSLQKLIIRGCPLVKKRCKMGEGEDWPMIAHIPYVNISDEEEETFRHIESIFTRL